MVHFRGDLGCYAFEYRCEKRGKKVFVKEIGNCERCELVLVPGLEGPGQDDNLRGQKTSLGEGLRQMDESLLLVVQPLPSKDGLTTVVSLSTGRSYKP